MENIKTANAELVNDAVQDTVVDVVETVVDTVETVVEAVNDVADVVAETVNGDTPAETIEKTVAETVTETVAEVVDAVAEEIVEEATEPTLSIEEQIKLAVDKNKNELTREFSKQLGVNLFEVEAIETVKHKLNEYDRLVGVEAELNLLKEELLFRDNNIPEKNAEKIKKIIKLEMASDNGLSYEDAFNNVVKEFPELTNAFVSVEMGADLTKDGTLTGIDAYISEQRERNPDKYKNV